MTISASCSRLPDSRRSESTGLLIGALFDRARELGRGQDRHVQLARQHLQVARDVRDFLHAVVVARIAAHQLQVIDDTRSSSYSRCRRRHLVRSCIGRDGRGIIQEDVGIGKHLDGMGEKRPFFFVQLAGAQALGIDAGFLGDQALDQLLVGHFQREHGDMLLISLGGVFQPPRA